MMTFCLFYGIILQIYLRGYVMIGSNITNIDEVKSINFSGTCGKLIVHEDDIQSPTIKCKRGLFSYHNSGNVEIVSFLDELKIYTTSGSAEVLVPCGFKMEEINVSGTSFDIDISDVSIKKINVNCGIDKRIADQLIKKIAIYDEGRIEIEYVYDDLVSKMFKRTQEIIDSGSISGGEE